MILKENGEPSIRRQCELIDLDYSTHYRNLRVSRSENLEKHEDVKQAILDVHYDQPSYGTRRLAVSLTKDYELPVGRKLVRSLMVELGIHAIFPGPKTTVVDPSHQKYPYLLKGVKITHVNQVWSTDITYLRLNDGWAYLVAIIDWYSRKILSWKLSNSLDRSFCIEALNEALTIAKPEIFNTDQGCQFTSAEFTDILKNKGIKISMDGKGRALDNVFIERFWRSLKHEHVFLHDYDSMLDLRQSVASYIEHYNFSRYHQSLGYQTPNQVWEDRLCS